MKKIEVNYLYFLLVLLCIGGLSCLYFPFLDIPRFFFICALGQALLEVGLFVLAAHLLRRFAPHWMYLILTTLIFGLLAVHFTDFIMLRLMDTSIMYFLSFLIGHGIAHMISVFDAINMNQTMIILMIGVICSIPVIGIALDFATHRLSRKKPVKLSLLQISLFVACIGGALLTFEFFSLPQLSRFAHLKYQKTLPFGKTFLAPEQKCIALPGFLAPPKNQPAPVVSFAKKPNIYLFIIETLRKDFIHEITAPHLTQFADENIQFASSFSNANGTPHSWFAILHSMIPYHWKTVHDRQDGGSPALQMLKNGGYKIHVYSSADLRYFDMDKMLFGQNRELVDTIEEYPHSIEAWERDAIALCAFQKTDKEKEGHLFLFFLDATHSEYSVPPDFPLTFLPVPKQIDYLTLTKKDLEPIKNRYRNAIFYVDSLLNDFFLRLKKEGLYDDAIIAITGDHGEEFFEEGALFHGTHLNDFQTSVPLFFKFPNDHPAVVAKMATHLDIMPSLLHYLTGAAVSLFDGESIFAKRKWPYRIAVQQNGADHPCEFSLEKDGIKLYARFLDPHHIYAHDRLEILSYSGDDLQKFTGAFDFLTAKADPLQTGD